MSKLMVLFLGAHNNIKTWLCLSDIKWLRCRFVNLLPYRETHKTAVFFSFLFFCFLQKRESYVLPCSISNNENKGYLELGRYQLGNYDYICLRQHIKCCLCLANLLPETQSSLTEWRNIIGGYINLQLFTRQGGNVWLYQYATVRYYFEARVLTDYKACIFYFVLCLRLCLHRSRVLVK